MIGCKGEIYDIERQKFENSYETTNEPLDVFTQMMDFWPELQKLPEQDFISIDEYARLCYPKQEVGIYARRLENEQRFSRWGKAMNISLAEREIIWRCVPMI